MQTPILNEYYQQYVHFNIYISIFGAAAPRRIASEELSANYEWIYIYSRQTLKAPESPPRYIQLRDAHDHTHSSNRLTELRIRHWSLASLNSSSLHMHVCDMKFMLDSISISLLFCNTKEVSALHLPGTLVKHAVLSVRWLLGAFQISHKYDATKQNVK